MFKNLSSKGLDLVSVLLVLSVFTKELFSKTIGGVSVDLFGYTFFTIYFVFNFHKFKIPKIFWVITYLIIISTLISIFRFDYDYKLFLKVFIPTVIILSASYDVLLKRLNNLFHIFHFYLKVSFYAAIFGIVQWVLSIFGINILIKAPGLLDSIAYEPSHYAVIIMPAAVYVLKNFKKNIIESIVIVTSLILTFSFTSYFVLTFALLIPYINFRSLLKIVISIYLITFAIQFLPERVSVRLDSLNLLYDENNDYRDPESNLTTMSFSSNLDVMLYSLEKNVLTGAGLGYHSIVYEEYFKHDNYFKAHPWYGINSVASHSLTMRIIAELGVLGGVIFVLFLTKNYIKSNKQYYIHHVIALAIISHFFAKTLKLSGYIDYGTPFFIAFLLINKLHYTLSKEIVLHKSNIV